MCILQIFTTIPVLRQSKCWSEFIYRSFTKRMDEYKWNYFLELSEISLTFNIFYGEIYFMAPFQEVEVYKIYHSFF